MRWPTRDQWRYRLTIEIIICTVMVASYALTRTGTIGAIIGYAVVAVVLYYVVLVILRSR